MHSQRVYEVLQGHLLISLDEVPGAWISIKGPVSRMQTNLPLLPSVNKHCIAAAVVISYVYILSFNKVDVDRVYFN